MAKKKNAASKDWDDVYMDIVNQMKKNTEKFPNAIPQDEEDRLLKEKKKNKKKNKKHPYQFGVGFAPFYSGMGWGDGIGDSSDGGGGE